MAVCIGLLLSLIGYCCCRHRQTFIFNRLPVFFSLNDAHMLWLLVDTCASVEWSLEDTIAAFNKIAPCSSDPSELDESVGAGAPLAHASSSSQSCHTHVMSRHVTSRNLSAARRVRAEQFVVLGREGWLWLAHHVPYVRGDKGVQTSSAGITCLCRFYG